MHSRRYNLWVGKRNEIINFSIILVDLPWKFKYYYLFKVSNEILAIKIKLLINCIFLSLFLSDG